MNRFGYLLLLTIISLSLAGPAYAAQQAEEDKEQQSEQQEEKKKSNKVYAIKDRDGNIIGYTDDPNKGSEEVTIRKGTEYTPPEQNTVWTKVEPKVVEEPAAYTKFAIASPSNDATIRDNAGNIQVAFDIRPALAVGHKVQLLLDGAVISESRGVIQSAANVDRGTHSITAKIVDANNRVIKTASPVTVHLHRAVAGR